MNSNYEKTKKTVAEFVKKNSCVEYCLDLPIYRLYVDENGALHTLKTSEESYEVIDAPVEYTDFTPEEIKELKKNVYKLEREERFAEYFDFILSCLTDDYIDVIAKLSA